ncbi:MAG: hypothetical protein QXF56_05625 [Candidatus Micrarchaeia archaeon]
METVVRLEGAVEKVLERLVKEGYYKTKAEAIRAGILELGREYALIGGREASLVSRRIAEMDAEVKAGRKKLIPISEVAKKAGVKI